MTDQLNLMIIAGEPSGDLHGGNLSRQILSLDPEVRLFGMGGSRMEEAGVELVSRIGKTGVVGFWEVFKDIGRYRKIFQHLLEVMRERRPAAVILIDYPGFNIRFARRAHRENVRVIYYITPQLWAWGRGRIKKLKQFVDKLVVIFDFEESFYRPYGLDVEFVGHPLVDTLQPDLNPAAARRRLGLAPGPLIALLPGSRKSELERILPVLLESARLIRKKLREVTFVLPLASPVLRPLVEKRLETLPFSVKIMEDRMQTLLAASDLAIIASGTATLEAAATATPMIIVYKLSFLSWCIARLLIKISCIGLVNVVYGKKIVPEYVQYGARPARVARRAVALLSEPEVRARMVEKLKMVRERLGKPGASLRAARAVLNTVKASPAPKAAE